MVLYKRKKIRFIVSIAVLLFLPFFSNVGNAATTEESEEEILFITSYNSDTKYTYDNNSTFVETYTQLGGRYSTMVENMNATDLMQAHQWKKTLTDILDKHPKAKLVLFSWAVKHGAVSFISKMKSTSSFLFSVQWRHATEYVFRRIRPTSEAIIPKALT